MPEIAERQDQVRELLNACISKANSRIDLWAEFIRNAGVQRAAEVGVYRGDFAREMLRACDSLETYYMIDPWRHLAGWNKPANHEDSVLEQFYQETKAKTDFAVTKRKILRGKTTEVIDQIPDGELDFAYIDGDHTLKGITIDLVRTFPKLRIGGFLAGDDFTRSVWEHKTTFEPTLVFPYAVYFAEAVGVPIYALPYSQFCLQKVEDDQFCFVDLTGAYDDLTLGDHLKLEQLVKIKLWERAPALMSIGSKAKRLFSR